MIRFIESQWTCECGCVCVCVWQWQSITLFSPGMKILGQITIVQFHFDPLIRHRNWCSIADLFVLLFCFVYFTRDNWFRFNYYPWFDVISSPRLLDSIVHPFPSIDKPICDRWRWKCCKTKNYSKFDDRIVVAACDSLNISDNERYLRSVSVTYCSRIVAKIELT